MKSIIILICAVFLLLPSQSQAQLSYIQDADSRFCTTDECDVIVRQSVGITIWWSLHIRCLDASSSTGGLGGLLGTGQVFTQVLYATN